MGGNGLTWFQIPGFLDLCVASLEGKLSHTTHLNVRFDQFGFGIFLICRIPEIIRCIYNDKSRIPGAPNSGAGTVPKKLATTDLDDATGQVIGLTIESKSDAKTPESEPPPGAKPPNSNNDQKGKRTGKEGGKKNENGSSAGEAAESAAVIPIATKPASTPAPTPSVFPPPTPSPTKAGPWSHPWGI
ncbi:hypothetical protein QAD02_011035 [Eretmocerus hayati]|uniref:Uncharacterized protein n=1 Tax=Eretmocerus hayati TaxID=131215 RepID=A0ACC2NVF6_9HYME|nr:hypothetical protein QAD02_011035 [Eretmocerus hayati]